MLWAACCTAFFGFLRAGEFTCSSLQAFEPLMLEPQDVTVYSHENPNVVTVYLQRSKADLFGSGVRIYLGRTGQAVSCVCTSGLPGPSRTTTWSFVSFSGWIHFVKAEAISMSQCGTGLSGL